MENMESPNKDKNFRMSREWETFDYEVINCSTL